MDAILSIGPLEIAPPMEPTARAYRNKEMTIGAENESNQAKIVIQRQELTRQESKQAIFVMNPIEVSFSKK